MASGYHSLHEMGGGNPGEPNKSENVENVAKLIASIKNSVSDQGSVNSCFNKQLQIYHLLHLKIGKH